MLDNKKFAPEIDSALLDSLSAHIAIVNSEGTILKINKAWKTFNDENIQIGRPKTDANYFDALQEAIEMGNDYALKLLLGMKKVLDNEKDHFNLTYPLTSASKSYWFNLSIRPCNKDGTHFILINEDISSSMHAHEQQKEKENRYQIQFEQSLDGILITDTNGKIIDANPAACNILGWNHEELLALSHTRIIDVNDPNYQAALRRRKETGSYKLETHLIHKDGISIPAEISSRTYRSKDGKLYAIVSFRDISRRKAAEHNLLQTKRFTESALNSNPGIFFVLDKEANLIPWNDNFVSMLGYTSDELSGLNALDLVVEEQRPIMKSKIEECIRTGELSLETKIYTKDGQIRDYHIQANRFEQDGKVFVVGSGTDITKNKKIERENRKIQLMLEQLFKNSPIGIAIIDTNNKIQQINKSFEQIFEYSEEEIRQENINDLIVPTNKLEEAKELSVATRKGKSLQTETIRLTKNNREVPVLVGSVPVELDGEVIAIFGLYVDNSRQHEYSKKLEETLFEKETLLAELHHRVKNNLALITSLVELQVYEAENPVLKRELTNTKNRIMTIASIHETLYQNGNLSSIPFNNFLQELLDTATMQHHIKDNNMVLKIDERDLSLDINQSIPCGLFLNELLSLIFLFSQKDGDKKLNILSRQYGEKIHIIVEGNEIIRCPKEMKAHTSLHNVLLDTLVQQLEGELLWPNSENGNQKFELIFTKKNGNGPARKLLN